MPEKLIQKLLDQYNNQNDTTKPMPSEQYDYKLTESEFDMIISALREKQDA